MARKSCTAAAQSSRNSAGSRRTVRNSDASAKSAIDGVQLDNNGNGFVIAIGDSSCAPGSSLIEADLEEKPFTTLTTNFLIESPKPTEY